MDRRQLLRSAAGVALALRASRTAFAADHDLVIRGGRVIDPSQGIDRRADVAVRAGRIAAIGPEIPAPAGVEVVDASGRIVVPGLIDVHLHARDAELPPREILSTGVTTMVDAGSKGADNLEQILEIGRRAPNRLRVLLNIARLGNNPGGRGEFLDGLEQADVEKAQRAVAAHRDWIVGIKARLSRGISAQRDRDVLKLALQVAEPAALPVMIHVGDTATPLPQLLELLRPGDIVTHMYAPENGILDARGRVLPQVRAARQRGVLFDFGNGLNEHWRWEVAQRALDQDFAPDTISSDLNVPGRTAQVFDLPNVMSKFLLLGMPLPDVVARVTSRAARVFAALNDYGTLREGAAADVTVLESTEGAFEFADNYKGVRPGTQRLVTRAVVFAGKRVA
ncbi:MAG TPA: amidohydrolase/deacetylase family metallohydrolase [Gammaproteobacteria bacterium]|jgi:dihydroorotase|nr:amidohydrolase/deacetylase family metallohydrolase [Gammaproteobacteria bacterium]